MNDLLIIFLCEEKDKSPSCGIPVYVKDESLRRMGFAQDHRGGIIVEDWSYLNIKNSTVQNLYLVKHANGHRYWMQSDLVEIGGVNISVDHNLPNG